MKPKPNTIAPVAPNSIERTDAKTRKDARSLMDSGFKKIQNGSELAVKGGDLLRQAVNEWRSAGKDFAEAEEINQLEFKALLQPAEESGELWKVAAERKFQVEVAKKIYKALPQPARSLKDCANVINPLLIVTKQLELSVRGTQSAHDPPNAWTEFMSTAREVEIIVRRLVSSEPKDRWPREQLESYKRTLEPLMKEYEETEALLKETQTIPI